MVTPSRVPAATLKEYVALARRSPLLIYASGGAGAITQMVGSSSSSRRRSGARIPARSAPSV
jgi:hypothetical protein